MDCSLPGSSCPWDFPGKNTGVGCHALLQGISPTQGSNPGPLHWELLLLLLRRFSHVRLCGTPQTAAHQAALSLGFSRQEYWSGLPRPAPGDLPNPRIEPTSLLSPALAGGFCTIHATWEAKSGGKQ